MGVAIEAKRGSKGSKMLAVFVKFKGVELHANIELGRPVVGIHSFKDILNLGDRVHSVLEMVVVKGTEVSHPVNSTGLLSNNRASSKPLRAITGLKNTNGSKAIKFFLEQSMMVVGNRAFMGGKGTASSLSSKCTFISG